MLSLGFHVLIDIICGSLLLRVRSRNNSVLSIFLHALLSFLIIFSWKRRSINFLRKISLFNGLSDSHERRNRIKCPLGTFFKTVRMNGKMMNGKMRLLDRSENV